mgnify:CR=1
MYKKHATFTSCTTFDFFFVTVNRVFIKNTDERRKNKNHSEISVQLTENLQKFMLNMVKPCIS